MNGDSVSHLEDIVRRNVAALRSKANLTQQALADEMLLRGIPWTRETVAQVETTNRRLGFTEAIAVAACLDIPVARLAATGAATVAVGETDWSTAYLGAAIAGTAGETFSPESFSTPLPHFVSPTEEPTARREPAPARSAEPPDRSTPAVPPAERHREPEAPRRADVSLRAESEPLEPDGTEHTQKRTAERIERRLRLRVTASDVDSTAHRLWSRSLDSERERRVTDRHALTGGSLQAIRGHVSRDMDRELAHELGSESDATASTPPGGMDADEATWEAARLNIILANKGYGDSESTRWWNYTRHRELDDQTIAEAWRAGRYSAVSRLVQSLPDKHVTFNDF